MAKGSSETSLGLDALSSRRRLALVLGVGAWAWCIGAVVMAAAVVVTVVTGIDYVIQAVKLRRSALQNPGGR